MVLDGARIFHVNVNCRNLGRSRAFYESIGLHATTRTTPDATQPGAAFGLARARWDAWILVGDHGFDGGAVDLLEWQEPAPVGTPPESFHTQGFQRIGVLVPDLDVAMAAVVAHGGEVWSDPIRHTDEHVDIRLVMTSDPDGVVVELVEAAGPRVVFVGIVCADLERSVAWYESLGFREVARFASDSDDAAHLRLDGPVAFDEVVMAPPAGGEVTLMLAGFRTPSVLPAVARPANAVGMWRCALMLSDLDAACRDLDRLGVERLSDPVELAMGPDLPVLRFVCFQGPDGETLELIQQPS